MTSMDAEATPTATVPHHRYSHVKWFHAVNSQQKLVDACQEVTRLFYVDDMSRRSSLDRSPSVSSNNGASANAEAVPTPSVTATAFSPPPAIPSFRVFGIEADVQWHPSLGTAVMRHDPVPASLEVAAAAAAAGPPPSSFSPRDNDSSSKGANADLFSLEVFLYTLAQAVQGWKSHACAFNTAPPGPLHVIVKLDFKAFKAAQLFMTQAETHNWAGLEMLFTSSAASSSSRRRRSSLRSFVLSRPEASAGASSTAPVDADAALNAPPPPSVRVELWWNADVVAQPGAHVHPLAVAAAPRSEVLAVMARTAQALGHRVFFGFSLGWVLCPRVVPADILTAAPTRSSTAPVYAAYSEADDVPTMTAFLDDLAQALAAPTPTEASSCASTDHNKNTSVSSRRSGSDRSYDTPTHPPLLTAAVVPAACVHFFTFPMLFESVFADLYTEQEKTDAFAVAAESGGIPYLPDGKQQPLSGGVVSLASAIAGARRAAESRRVASAVVAHALRLFFPASTSRKGSLRDRERSQEEPVPPSTSAAPVAEGYESRCFPTFWKTVHPPPRPPALFPKAEGKGESSTAAATPGATTPTPSTPTSVLEAEEWQGNVNRAARSFFPYCTIDG